MFSFQKNPEKDFTVLNITDPQLGDPEWEEGHKHGQIVKYTLSELVRKEKPDLITVSGDVSWPRSPNAYRIFADFIDSFGIPWAPVWGNHDNECGQEFIDRHLLDFAGHPNLIYERGPEELGNGNYVLLVNGDKSPCAAVIMMDSHNTDPFTDENGEEKRVYSRLTDLQMDWYREQVRLLKSQGCRESVVIAHIPIFAFRKAFEEAFNSQYDASKVSSNDSHNEKYWNEGFRDSYGVCYENICSYPAEDGVFDVLKEEGHTKAFIVGHCHTNSFSINYEGIRLIFALKEGPGCYWHPDLNGGTVIKIGNNGISNIYHSYVNVSHLL